MRRRFFLVALALASGCERDFARPEWAGGEGGSGSGGERGGDTSSAGGAGEGGGGNASAGVHGGMAGAPASAGAGATAAGAGGEDAGAGGTGRANGAPVTNFDFYRFQRGAEELAGGAGGAGATGAPSSYRAPATNSLRKNDIDPDGDAVRVEARTAQTERGGTVSIEKDGTFTYTPPSDRFWGDDFFEYAVSDGELSSVGRARVTLWVPSVQLEELDAEKSNGFALSGAQDHASFGYFASPAGDVNGDGLADMILAERFERPDSAPPETSAYVVFGRKETTPLSLDELESETGTSAGFVIRGVRPAYGTEIRPEEPPLVQGQPINGAGDLNDDGFDDLVISSKPDPDASSAAVYVVFGRPGMTAPIALSDVSTKGSTPSLGIRIDPPDVPERFGTSVAAAGDMNGDGYDDLAIGAPGAALEAKAEVGAVYVVYGGARKGGKRFGEYPINVRDVIEGTGLEPGFLVRGSRVASRTGFSVAAAGDVNGDGLGDLVIGAPERSIDLSAGYADGTAYVVFGRSQRGTIDIGRLGMPSEGIFAITGSNGSSLGYSVSAAGYFDGDALPDVLLGIPDYGFGGSVYQGGSYVAFGRTDALSERIDEPGGYLARGATSGQWLGWTTGTGDFDGDGRSDAAMAGTYYPRRSYLAFGGESANTAFLDASCHLETSGAAFLCIDLLAPGVAGATTSGDFNGDGIDDVFVGAPTSHAPRGGGYVLFGWDMRNRVEGRHLSFSGGAGDDEFAYSGGDILRLAGGHGVDTIVLHGRGFAWDLRGIEPTRLVSIERIDLRSPGNQVLLLDDAHVRSLPSTRRDRPLRKTLMVLGNAGDTVRIDLQDFTELEEFEERRIFQRIGRHYGIEIDRAVTISEP